MMKFFAKNLDDNEKIAEYILHFFGSHDHARRIVCLDGEMGAGKTTFAKFLAKSLGLDPDEVVSPTYGIEDEHVLGMDAKLFHLDLWRVENVEELEMLNLSSRVSSNDWVVIEWGQKFPAWIASLADKNDILYVRIANHGVYDRIFEISQEL